MSAEPATGPSAGTDPIGVGDELPSLEVELTPSFVITAALASRDLEPVHHDRSAAEATGMDDVFLNILTTNGLVVRLVTDWAGPDAVVRRSSVRLGVPAVAGDTLRLTGRIAAIDDGVVVVEVAGRVSGGDHVTGTVEVEPGGGP